MGKNIVYFLGAGFSKNFRYPITSEIMPLIMDYLLDDDLFQLEDEKTELECSLELQLRDFLYTLYPGLRGVDPARPRLRKRIPNVTEVLSLVDHFCLHNLPPHPSIADGNLTQFRDLLNRAISELILTYDLEPMNEKELVMFDKLMAPLRNLKMENNVSIITTNYDLLIDYAFQDLFLGHQVDYGISYRDVDTSELIRPPEDPLFHYYKLHGSLNWLRCDLCGQYYINPDGAILHQTFKEELTDGNTCICSYNLRLRSVLVAPSLVRDIRDANLLQIWKSAMEAIRTADQLVFIGYSMPAEDLAIKSIIMRGLNGRDRRPPPEVTVVTKGSNARPNYQNIFGKKINYIAGGLEAYLKV